MGIEKIVKPVVGAVVVGGLAAGLYFGMIKPSAVRSEYMQTYHRALLDHADTNHDGLVSAAEQDEFDRKLLKDKGVTLIPDNMPKYKDGRTVPTEVVTEWVRNYRPSD